MGQVVHLADLDAEYPVVACASHLLVHEEAFLVVLSHGICEPVFVPESNPGSFSVVKLNIERPVEEFSALSAELLL
jgi:hypothetical protein